MRGADPRPAAGQGRDAPFRPGRGALMAPPADSIPPNDSATGALAARIEAAAGRRAAPRAVVPAEAVSLMVVDLPVRSDRQRLAALPFAIEDRIATPIEGTHMALGPAPDPARPARRLAAVLSRDAMRAALAAAPPGAMIVPETLSIPRPLPGGGGDGAGAPDDAAAPLSAPGVDAARAAPAARAWAVWVEGDRAVVRADDGTGFAARVDMLPALWDRAGRPALTRLAGALPAGLPARDMSAAPPPPDPADLSFDLRQGAFAPRGGGWAGSLQRIAALLLLGAAGHLGLAAADLAALSGIADDERARARAAAGAVLPGLPAGADPAPILARLAPAAPAQPSGGDLLPMLSTAAAALGGQGVAATFRRLSFAQATGVLTLQVQAPGLDGLQAAERALASGGFDVSSGTATAGEGTAEAEMRLTRAGDA